MIAAVWSLVPAESRPFKRLVGVACSPGSDFFAAFCSANKCSVGDGKSPAVTRIDSHPAILLPANLMH